MSEDLERATRDAVEAARQGEQFAVMLAAIQAAQVQQPCQHHPVPAPRPSNTGKWVAAGVGGSVLLMTVAVSAVAFAISAVSLTVCLLVLRSVWQDMRRKD